MIYGNHKIDFEREIPANILCIWAGRKKVYQQKEFLLFYYIHSDYIENYMNIYIQYLAVLFELGLVEIGEYVDDDNVEIL